MEACGGAHHPLLGAQAERNGPYREADGAAIRQALHEDGQNDAADAEAICEAVTWSNMRFVAIKAEQQQDLLVFHLARRGFVKARTAQAN